MKKTNIRSYLNISFELEYFKDVEKELSGFLKNEYKLTESKVDVGLEFFDTGYIETPFSEEVINIVINKIRKEENRLNNVNKLKPVVKRIEVVIHCYDNQMPSIHLDKATLQFLNTFELEIEFDIYNFE